MCSRCMSRRDTGMHIGRYERLCAYQCWSDQVVWDQNGSEARRATPWLVALPASVEANSDGLIGEQASRPRLRSFYTCRAGLECIAASWKM